MTRGIVVAPWDGGWRAVHGLRGDPAALRVRVADREANGDAFPGAVERVVRVPRRIARRWVWRVDIR